MQLLDLTLPTAAENLALDEALLEAAEAGDGPREVLRLWEGTQPMVVVGRASQVAVEVDVAQCRRRGIPIFRRTSGGAAIVTGAGCLMYAVVLSYQLRPHLRMIDAAHRFVLDTVAEGLRASLGEQVQRCGISDLAIDGRMKFSGNSLRCCRSHLLYHGTLLYGFPLELIEACLLTPPRQPEYRAGRGHGEFVTNVHATGDQLRRAITGAWDVDGSPSLNEWPREKTAALAREKYLDDAWNLRR